MKTRQEFLMEVTLRLAGNLIEFDSKGIVDMAKDITDRVFDAYKEQENENQWWPKEVDEEPISKIINFIMTYKYRGSGYGIRLNNLFIENNIKTVGDILRIGKIKMSNIKNLGKGSITRIDDALEGLYNIKSW